MSYKIVFFDIDGTLINEHMEIPQDTIDAVKQLKANGIEPVIATGRSPFNFEPLLKKLDIHSFVSLNGTYVVYKGKPLYKQTLPKEHIKKLIEYAERNQHSLVFVGSDDYFTNIKDHPFVLESLGSLHLKKAGFDPDFWQKTDIYQIFLNCKVEDEPLYKEMAGDLRMIRWHEKAMDVTVQGSSKAEGIKAMLDKLNLTTADAVAFGDGLNDKEMLDEVGLGIAMGNAHPDLLPLADYVTASVDEGGISQGLRYAGLIK